MSSTAAHSSSLCMVALGRPKSTTGHSWIRKRPSDVPPLVDSSGLEAGFLLDRRDDDVVELARRGQEGLAGNARADGRARRLALGDLLDHPDQVGAALQIVEADVELGGRRGRE